MRVKPDDSLNDYKNFYLGWQDQSRKVEFTEDQNGMYDWQR